MLNILLGLPLITAFFMVLVQAATPQPLDFGSAFGGGDPFANIPTCKTLKCATDRVCVQMYPSAQCGIPKGKPCSFDDVCEGGYYCLNKKTCSGSGLLPINSPCERNECDKGLYCDLKAKKCLKMGTK